MSNPPALIVRPLTPADEAAFLPLWQGYNTFYHADVPAAVTAETWRRFHDPAMPVHILGAWKSAAGNPERLIGFATYLFHLSTWSMGPSCYLEDLFTAPDARGLGAGRALIAGVTDAARAAGASRLHWLTQQSNTVAQSLYDVVAKRSGFIDYHHEL